MTKYCHCEFGCDCGGEIDNLKQLLKELYEYTTDLENKALPLLVSHSKLKTVDTEGAVDLGIRVRKALGIPEGENMKAYMKATRLQDV